MEVYEIKLKVYALKDIQNENALTCISELIDNCFLKDEVFSNFHKDNCFKNYTYNSLFPIENTKIYKAGNIYTVLIRTVDKKLAKCFKNYLANEYSSSLKGLSIDMRTVVKKHIDKIYSITPAVAKFSNGYWRTSETLEVFEKRLRENLIKKYNNYFDTKIQEDFELFTFIKFNNHKPIATDYKNIRILGDKLTLSVAENSMAQDLVYFALGTGILEMNSRGFGFVNFKYL